MAFPEPQRDVLSGNEKDIFEDGFVRLNPRTHDTSFSQNHSDIQKLGNDLNEAVQAAWPKRHDIRYSQVHVLLLSWKDDDLGVAREIKTLRHVFRDMYNFQVQEYQIPSSKPARDLNHRVSEFLGHQDIDGKDNLLILYYGGHARRAMQSNEGPLWFANRDTPSTVVPSGGIQSMFEEADADALLLFDCCHSAAVPTADCPQRTGGVVEVIAACGYETIAAEVDQHSFTKALTCVLAMASKGLPFSIGVLHSRVLSRLKCWTPDPTTDEEGRFIENGEGNLLLERQPRRTPIYSIICATRPHRSIILGPVSTPSSSSPSPDICMPDTSETSSPPPISDNTAEKTSKKRKRSADEHGGKLPQVLLAVRLDDRNFDLQKWIEWIRNAPPEAKSIHIEGSYDSFSTLVLLRMPVAVWNLVPENSAYSFVGFVTSGNKTFYWGQDGGAPFNIVQPGLAEQSASSTNDSTHQLAADFESAHLGSTVTAGALSDISPTARRNSYSSSTYSSPHALKGISIPMEVVDATDQYSFRGRKNNKGSDSDSGFFIDDEYDGYTSIGSSIQMYREENGRTYHAYKDGAYWAPNDERQNESLDISHHVFFLVLSSKLYLAPLSGTIEKVLDIGTGTGIWAMDFADQHPETTVYGTDLSPIQPKFVPPNCFFVIDDAREEGCYPTDHFDFVHIRGLFGSIDDWPALYTQIYNHLKPGGYIEQVELSIDITSDDGTVEPDSPLVTFTNCFTDAGKRTGQTFRISDTMKQEIEAAGFVNAVETVYKIPLGGWAKDPKLQELGLWALFAFQVDLEGYAMATLTRVLGWDPAEVHVFLARVREAAQDRKIHSLYEIKVVYAQKPQ